MIKTSKIHSESDPEKENIARLNAEFESLNDWRYRIHSTLLVASSAILVLSFSLPASEAYTSHIEFQLMTLAGVLNAIQILACITAFGILLRFRIARARIYEQAVQRAGELPGYQGEHIPIRLSAPMKFVYQASEIASLLLFAVVVVLLAVCRILALA